MLLEIRQKIEGLAGPLLAAHGAFFVDVQVRNERGGKFIQLFIDTDRGITIEECAEISRELLRELDTRRVFEGDYRLEVSSPGADRPLKFLRQYSRNVGRRFKIRYSLNGEQKTAIARLQSVVNDVLAFQAEDGKELAIPFQQIVESKVELPW